MAIQSSIKSFYPLKNTNVFISVARAGNVIGGGDWSNERLIPDCIRSWSKNRNVYLRNPKSTRPWQHVLEAIYGYLLLAEKLKKSKKLHGEVFNFGPNNNDDHSVVHVVNTMKKYWKKVSWKVIGSNKVKFYESSLLKLNSNKAKSKLKWKCILTFSETIKMVIDWYISFYTKPKNIVTVHQIKEYEKLLERRRVK